MNLKLPKLKPKLNPKRISIFVLLLMMISAGFFYFLSARQASADWWNGDWFFRRNILVTNNTTEENNVYITLTLDTSNQEKFQADCGDIRFVTSNGTILEYYIVSGCGATSTIIHTNFEVFPAGVQTISFYYGNATVDNGFNTSDFTSPAFNYTIGTIYPEEKGPAPALYLPLDEGFGTTAHDESSNRNDGTIVGATWKDESECKSGKCLEFDGNGDYVEVADTSSLDLDNEFTLEAWIKPQSTTLNNQTILSKVETPNEPTKIFRSVAPGATTALSVGTTNSMSIIGERAIFQTALPDNVGVGDAIEYDDDNDNDIDANDSIVFIKSRVSNKEYLVATASGTVPVQINNDNNWSLFRAYTSLANAEKGVENTGIDIDLRNFDNWTAGGDATADDVGKDIVTSNEQWNIACYANGTTGDTTAVTLNGWTTGVNNHISIYTPVSASEVGISQRHNGKLENTKYYLQASNLEILRIYESFVRVDGIQIDFLSGNDNKALRISNTDPGVFYISNNIIRGDYDNTNPWNAGIAFYGADWDSVGYVFNNIVYDFKGASNSGIQNLLASIKDFYAYNNTLYNNTSGIALNDSTQNNVLKNNIFSNCSGDITYNNIATIGTSSLSNLGVGLVALATGESIKVGTTTGVSSSKLIDSSATFISNGIKVGSIIKNTTDASHTYVTAVDSETQLSVANNIFVSGEGYRIYKNKYGTANFISTTTGSEDFHLSSADTAAKDSGADLSSDNVFPFATDIDGQSRLRSSSYDVARWDIGADETGATQIYRSVAPGKTDALENGEENSLTIVGNTATFQRALADNVGVGDVIQYDDDNDGDIDASDSLAFIAGRISNFEYIVTTASGSVPTTVIGDNDWSLFRAYTSLVNAENGDENTGIDSDLRNFDIWSGGKNLVTSKEQWNIACYANGTEADTEHVEVNNWTTGVQNFIKIYTPVNENEVGISQRHSGKWDANAYHIELSNVNGITVFDNHVFIDGIQIYKISANDHFQYGIAFQVLTPGAIGKVSNCIIRQSGNDNYRESALWLADEDATFYAFNNIIYGLGNYISSDNSGININSNTSYIYNNTVIGGYISIHSYGGDNLVKNNITSSFNDGYGGVFNAGSDFNLSNKANDAPSPSYRSGLATDVSFVSTTAGIEDFHLSKTDILARNAGINLANDLNLSVTSDIDGEIRDKTKATSTWDIGADESTATKIFRSVGPGNTTALSSDNNHENTVSVTDGVATFEASLPNRIGVGDAVLIDTNSDNAITSADTLLFIHGRNSSNSYDLRTHTGAMPIDISSNDTYQIYRAYTSLTNAENGIKNTAIPIIFNGGNRDLVANNEEWNIACYGDTAELIASQVLISGWGTGSENYIKIYTPTNSYEVGVSQRHDGKWDNNKYYISGAIGSLLNMSNNNVRIEGLQFHQIENGNSTYRLIRISDTSSDASFYISNNIFKGDYLAITSGSGHAIYSYSTVAGKHYIYNNIFYDFATPSSENSVAVILNGGVGYLYNNTFYDNEEGIEVGALAIVTAKNNIVNNTENGYTGSFTADSDFNISNVASDAPGANSKNSTTVTFRDAANNDFRLAMTDTSSKGAGLNLSNDSILPVNNDIEGEQRPLLRSSSYGEARPSNDDKFDIGADQISNTIHSNYSLNINSNYPSATYSTSQSDNVSYSSGDINLEANTWSHIVYKRNADTEELYVNGAKKDAKAISDFVKTNNGKLYIGAENPNSKNSFKGLLDEIRIYNYPRTDDEIKKDTTQGSSGKAASRASEGVSVAIGKKASTISDGLVGYWKFDENATTSGAIDSSGNGKNGTYYGTASTTGGKFGNGGVFEGSNDSDYIRVGNIVLDRGYTVSTWAFVTDNGLYNQLGLVSTVALGFGMQYRDFGNNDRLYVEIGSDYNYATIENNKCYLTWCNYAMTYNIDGTVEIYLNGEDIGGFNTSQNLSFTQNIAIGQAKLGNHEYFDGKIDETRIYNRALSPDEVKQLYNYAPGPILHLKLDEKSGITTFDSSGNGNNGTLVDGPIWENGKIGGALDFDGVNDYVDAGASNLLDFGTGSFTASYWMKIPSVPDEGLTAVVNKLSHSYTDGWYFFVNPDLSVGFWYRWDATHYTDKRTNILNVGEWYYITAKADRADNTVRLYVNGIEQGATSDISGWGNIDAEGFSLKIGMRRPDYPFFKGSVDDVKIYNYARTQEQIFEDMKGSSGVTFGGGAEALKSPVLDLGFDEGIGTTTYDESGYNNHGSLNPGIAGTNISTSSMWDKGGKFGGAMEFDGTDDFINIGHPSSLELYSDLSISFCFMADTWGSSGLGRIISKRDGAWAPLEIFVDNDGLLEVSGWDNLQQGYEITSSIVLDKWYCGVYTFSNNIVKLYLNGELVGSDNTTADLSNQPTYNWYLGKEQSARYFDGLIDEVKIYNYALDEEAVKTLYNNSFAFVMGGDSSRNNNGTAVTGANKDYCVPGDTARCDKPVLEFKFNEMTGTTAYDTSGNARNGTLRNGPVWDLGESGSALNFDGVDDDVNNIPDSGIRGNFSISAWIKPDTLSGERTIYYPGGLFVQQWGSSLYWRIVDSGCLSDGSGADVGTISLNNILIKDKWQYVTFVSDATNNKIYIYYNGRVGLEQAGKSDCANANTDNIGSTNSRHFDGSIDELRVYNYVRTPAQIAWDYNRGKAIAHWKMDEGEGLTVHDNSGNSYHGSMSGMDSATDWIAGKNNKALDFDGTNDYVDIGQTISGYPVSISAWIKSDRDDIDQIPVFIGPEYEMDGFQIQFRDDGKIYAATNGITHSNGIPYVKNQWHHVVAVYAASTSRQVFVDGQASDIGIAARTPSGFQNTWIGRAYDWGVYRYFDGQIDDVKIFNYVLTEEQLKMEYNGGAVNFR